MKRGLKTFFEKLHLNLGRIPSLIYALCYLVAIFIFATIYTLLPFKSFYHTTSRYEESLNNDADVIQNDIREIILDNVYISDNYINISDSIKIDLETFLVHSIFFDDENNFGFTIDITGYLKDNNVFSQFGYKQIFSISPKKVTKIVDEISNDLMYRFTLMPEQIDKDIPGVNIEDIYRSLFSNSNDALYPGSENYVIEIPEPLYDKIRCLRYATNGFPPSNNFWRMFYLSAITITTVGYGDILPLTEPARILVACEAILGIIISGLFLNSIAYELKSNIIKQDPTQPPPL